MRLSKLARTLGIIQGDIIKYLESNKLANDLNAHSKLDEELVLVIRKEFDPTGEIFEKVNQPEKEDTSILVEPTDYAVKDEKVDLSIDEIPLEKNMLNEEVLSSNESIESENTEESAKEPEEQILINAETDIVEISEADSNTAELEEPKREEIFGTDLNTDEPKNSKQEETSDDSNDENSANDEDSDEEIEEFKIPEGEEVIRAKLVKLEGIKVVGKIDLPPPPVKKEKTEEEKVEKTEKRRASDRQSRKKYKPRPPESYQQKLEREQRKLERDKKRKQRELKEKKKQHYLQKIEGVDIKKAVSPVKSTSKKISNNKKKAKKTEIPKNPIKRLWGWLNGHYDSY